MLSPDNPKSYLDKKIEVLDGDRCLCRGVCKVYKDGVGSKNGLLKVCFVSIDDRYFFNANSDLVIRESDGPDLEYTAEPGTELTDWHSYGGEPVKIITDMHSRDERRDFERYPKDSLGCFPVGGQMYEVRDRNGEVLARGFETNRKFHHPGVGPMKLVSFDGKWFFNERYDGLQVIPVENDLEPIPFTKMDEIPWQYWRYAGTPDPDTKRPIPCGIYREFGMDELDPEIEPLVTELNKWPHIETIGSCCGHGEGYAWVQMTVSDIKVLHRILKPMRSPSMVLNVIGRMQMVTSPPQNPFHTARCVPFRDRGGLDDINMTSDMEEGALVVIATTSIGEEAYVDAKAYAELLRQLRERYYGTE